MSIRSYIHHTANPVEHESSRIAWNGQNSLHTQQSGIAPTHQLPKPSVELFDVDISIRRYKQRLYSRIVLVVVMVMVMVMVMVTIMITSPRP